MTIINLDENNFDQKTSKGVTLVDFYADWWGPCRMFEQVLENVTPTYEDKINMYKVNIEEEPEIAGLFGVRSIPTLLVFKDGTVINQIVGSVPKNRITEILDSVI